jgi:hypothetical protein
VPAYNVAAGHSRWGSLRVSDAGGSTEKVLQERPCFCDGIGHSLAQGAPKVFGGENAWLEPVIQRT